MSKRPFLDSPLPQFFFFFVGLFCYVLILRHFVSISFPFYVMEMLLPYSLSFSSRCLFLFLFEFFYLTIVIRKYQAS